MVIAVVRKPNRLQHTLCASRVSWEDQTRVDRETLHSSDAFLARQTNATNSSVVLPEVQWFEDNVLATRNEYIKYYTIGMLVVLGLVVNRSFGFFAMCLRASRNMHDQLFRGITRAWMSFFNTNPSGRILNRFSKDIDNIDTLLPLALMDCTLVRLGFTNRIVRAHKPLSFLQIVSIRIGRHHCAGVVVQLLAAVAHASHVRTVLRVTIRVR